MEPGRRALVKEFYANLGERKGLTCYVRGRWIPFGKKGHLPTLGAQISREVRRVRAAPKEPMLCRDSLRVDKWSKIVAKD